MNNVIKHLDSKTINLIAAGEVVESPYSVVKELIENSIDANSKNIILEIRDGGKSYIRVTDDGDGIEEQYILTAFERHTTSKIQSFEDFCFVRTNGFRGEALASISAVSLVTLTTKTAENFYGSYIKLDCKNVIEQNRVGANNGTTIIIENLLYNVPARKSFLKSAQAETSKISQLITKFALINNNIKFKYINNDKVIFTTFGNSSIVDAVNLLYYNQYKNKLIQLSDHDNKAIRINGVLGNNSIMESSRRNQHIYVNKRIIISKLLNEAIESAYRPFIPSGKFPVYILNIEVDPDLIDINVHPNKLDVKFSNDIDISYFIKQAVAKVLNAAVMIPDADISQRQISRAEDRIKIMDLPEDTPYENVRLSDLNIVSDSDNIISSYSKKEITIINDPEKSFYHIKESPVQKKNVDLALYDNEDNTSSKTESIHFNYCDLIYIGVFIRSYIIFQIDDSMYLMDQHAAHERILYEKYLDQFKKQTIVTQQMIVPFIITISIEMIDYISEILDQLKQFGIDGEMLSERSVAIRGIPGIFTESQTRAFIDETLDLIVNNKEDAVHIPNMIASKACKAAIKANSSILEMEVDYLLKELDLCSNKYSCPHGRPITVKLTRYDLEKMFKRVI